MFEQHTEWWDVLCNINTGKILVNQQWQVQFQLSTWTFNLKFSSWNSQKIPSSQPTQKSFQPNFFDPNFFPTSTWTFNSLSQPQVEKMMQTDQEWTNQVIASVNSHYGEDSIRSLLQNFTQHILYMAFDEEEFPDVEAGQVELEKYRYRIDTWRRTLTGKIYAVVSREFKLKVESRKWRDFLLGKNVRKFCSESWEFVLKNFKLKLDSSSRVLVQVEFNLKIGSRRKIRNSNSRSASCKIYSKIENSKKDCRQRNAANVQSFYRKHSHRRTSSGGTFQLEFNLNLLLSSPKFSTKKIRQKVSLRSNFNFQLEFNLNSSCRGSQNQQEACHQLLFVCFTLQKMSEKMQRDYLRDLTPSKLEPDLSTAWTTLFYCSTTELWNSWRIEILVT